MHTTGILASFSNVLQTLDSILEASQLELRPATEWSLEN